MQLNLRTTILLVAALFVLDEGDARACSVLSNFPHSIDEAEAAVDDTPPGEIPEVVASEVDESTQVGCDDCGGGGMHMTLDVTPPTDDRTRPEDIGYEIEVVDGEFPFFVPVGPVGPAGGTLIMLRSEFDYRVFSATLEVRPVDRAGNVGPGTRVEVRNGVRGCNMSVGSGGGVAWLAIAALQWLARRRRVTAAAA
jgi:hypothetical protein